MYPAGGCSGSEHDMAAPGQWSEVCICILLGTDELAVITLPDVLL